MVPQFLVVNNKRINMQKKKVSISSILKFETNITSAAVGDLSLRKVGVNKIHRNNCMNRK